ncbi:MAG: hypothetical protein HQ579_05425 [Candidatus Omnitrophica bacterium]|nr:hypothetical protein [Candidatus Omnitrophota bacterium]
MRRTFNYDIHNIITMRIAIEDYTSFKSNILRNKFANYEVKKNIDNPDLDILIGPFVPNKKDSYVVDNRYFIKENYIYCVRKHKIATWQVAVEGFGKDKTRIKIASNLPGWWVFPGDTIYSIIFFQLAIKGYAMLHASGATQNGRAYIFAGRSGTGKTITLLNLIRKGYGCLGDDSVIVGTKNVLSFIKPLNIRFTYDVEKLTGIKFNKKDRIAIALKNALRFLSIGHLNLFTKINIKEIFSGCLDNSAILEKIFFMTQGKNFNINRISCDNPFIKQMLINTQLEVEELCEYLLVYSYVFPEKISLDFWHNFEKIIKTNISKAKKYEVSIPRSYSISDFDQLYRKINERD